MKKLNSLQFEATIFYRYGTIMRQVLKTPKIEFCSVMKFSSSNILLNEIIKIGKNIEPTLIHECPYTNFIVNNRTLDISSLPSILNAGTYKVLINATQNSKLFAVTEVIMELFSSEKSSFG